MGGVHPRARWSAGKKVIQGGRAPRQGQFGHARVTWRRTLTDAHRLPDTTETLALMVTPHHPTSQP
jgi:hypothetical protein